MSEERTVDPGERRVERVRQERGVPVRRAPVAVGALVGGALGAWAADVPGHLLATVRDGLAGAGTAPLQQGGGEVRSAVLSVAAAAWAPLALGALGATAGAVAQTGGRLRRVAGGGVLARMPAAGDAGGAAVRLAWAVAVMLAAAWAVAVDWPRIAAMPAMPLQAALDAAASVAADAVIAALAACALLAAADVAIARWRWRSALRMTPEEAREERRSTDGDPALRGRRQAAARRNAGMARGKELRGQAA
jgi:flagellar biosynthesis protein FlhB